MATYKELAEALTSLPSYTPDQLGTTVYRHGDHGRKHVRDVRLMLLSNEHRKMLVKACFTMAQEKQS